MTLSDLHYKVDINAILLTATFEVTVPTVTGTAVNTEVPSSQLLKHIIAIQNTSILATAEAKKFNADNGRKFEASKKEGDGGECQEQHIEAIQTVVDARLKPIAKAWEDIYSELTDKTEDAPPKEIYATLDKCLDEYWAAIQEVTKGVKNNVGKFTQERVKEVLEENLKQFKITGPEFNRVVGPSVDEKKLSGWVDKTYEYLNAGIEASK